MENQNGENVKLQISKFFAIKKYFFNFPIVLAKLKNFLTIIKNKFSQTPSKNNTRRNFVLLDVVSQQINTLDAFLFDNPKTSLNLKNRMTKNTFLNMICWDFSLLVPFLVIYFALIIIFYLIKIFRCKY